MDVLFAPSAMYHIKRQWMKEVQDEEREGNRRIKIKKWNSNINFYHASESVNFHLSVKM